MEARCCCNCGKKDKQLSSKNGKIVVECTCTKTNQKIQYPHCYEDWCKFWCKEK